MHEIYRIGPVAGLLPGDARWTETRPSPPVRADRARRTIRAPGIVADRTEAGEPPLRRWLVALERGVGGVLSATAVGALACLFIAH